MIYTVSIILIIIIIFVYIINSGSKAGSWFTLFGISIIFGAISLGIENYIRYIADDSYKVYVLLQINNLFATFFYYFFPYTLLIACLVFTGYEEKLKVGGRKVFHLILLLPVVIMYIVFPYNSLYFSPVNNPYFIIIAIWAVLYVFISILLSMKFVMKETNPRMRRERFIRFWLVTLPAVSITITCYIMIAFGSRQGTEYFIPCTFAEFIFFMILLFKDGIYGVRIKMEKYYLDRDFRTFNSAASMFSHAFKNEALKMSLCCENIQRTEKIKKGDSLLEENVEIIHNASKHILELTSRVQEKLHEFEVVKAPNDIVSLIEQALDHMSALINKDNVKIIKDFPVEARIMCDSLYVREMLHNILKNALEAMNGKGEIGIYMTKKKRYILIEIKDSGPGIPKEILPHVIEPFFTTKNQNVNFGLGLCYCYNVMEKHSGKLRLESNPGSGTTVQLEFLV